MRGRETGTPNQLAGPDTLIQQPAPVPTPGIWSVGCVVFFNRKKKGGGGVRRAFLHANGTQPEEPIKM